jgi:hypothetical protein
VFLFFIEPLLRLADYGLREQLAANQNLLVLLVHTATKAKKR